MKVSGTKTQPIWLPERLTSEVLKIILDYWMIPDLGYENRLKLKIKLAGSAPSRHLPVTFQTPFRNLSDTIKTFQTPTLRMDPFCDVRSLNILVPIKFVVPRNSVHKNVKGIKNFEVQNVSSAVHSDFRTKPGLFTQSGSLAALQICGTVHYMFPFH